MNAELTFDKARLRLGYGLVRLGKDFKIIDKNLRAEKTGVFPKRGASILKYTDSGKKALTSLSEKTGDNTVISVSNGIKRLEALAIREAGGAITLLLHPLICSFTLGKSGRTSISYGEGLLKTVYGESIERALSLDEIFPLFPISVKHLTRVTTAVEMICEKISKLSFKDPITVNFEGIEKSLFAAVNFTALIYAFSEILSVENTFSDGKGASITFKGSGESFDIFLEARMRKNAASDGDLFARIFSEALRLIDVTAEVSFSADGFLYARASVKTEVATSFVREPGVYVEEAIFGYFDYSMKYYELLENEQ